MGCPLFLCWSPSLDDCERLVISFRHITYEGIATSLSKQPNISRLCSGEYKVKDAALFGVSSRAGNTVARPSTGRRDPSAKSHAPYPTLIAIWSSEIADARPHGQHSEAQIPGASFSFTRIVTTTTLYCTYTMAGNDSAPLRGGGLSLYANLLDPSTTSSATISRAPVAFQPSETSNAGEVPSQKHQINTGRYS